MYTGKVLVYANPSACLDRHLCPARKISEKRSQKGQCLVNKEGVVKLLTTIVTIAEIWAGALSYRSRTCLKSMTGRHFQ